ncbi:hypothetical protein V501_09218 [Pseudogymnoascus sp. VKM F-4519 (FW-2642)]|nr:hypothetical protein V501_09218 [Pseudogymnoascus sp. VKM F-4519 (FW-2642)]
MPIIRKALYTAILGTTGVTGLAFFTTRKSIIVPVPATDPIYSSSAYLAQNPNNNPVTQDIVIRRLPLSSIRPELLEKEGALVEAVTAGVFGGLAYEFQRRYLERKYRNPSTKTDLWTRSAINSSDFAKGTIITDHFEVVDRSPTQVTVRCGGSPREQGVRGGDGLFKVAARVEKEKGEVELSLTSVFFQGKGVAAAEPMSSWIKWLHGVYGKLWIEDAARRVQV